MVLSSFTKQQPKQQPKQQQNNKNNNNNKNKNNKTTTTTTTTTKKKHFLGPKGTQKKIGPKKAQKTPPKMGESYDLPFPFFEKKKR